MDFPYGSLCEHHKSESSVSQQASCPAIIGAVESAPDLVQIISTSCFPFDKVVLEDVVAISKGIRVAIGLQVLRAVRSVDVGVVVEVNIVAAVRWFKSHVIVARISVLPEVTHWYRHQLLKKQLSRFCLTILRRAEFWYIFKLLYY